MPPPPVLLQCVFVKVVLLKHWRIGVLAKLRRVQLEAFGEDQCGTRVGGEGLRGGCKELGGEFKWMFMVSLGPLPPGIHHVQTFIQFTK